MHPIADELPAGENPYDRVRQALADIADMAAHQSEPDRNASRIRLTDLAYLPLGTGSSAETRRTKKRAMQTTRAHPMPAAYRPPSAPRKNTSWSSLIIIALPLGLIAASAFQTAETKPRLIVSAAALLSDRPASAGTLISVSSEGGFDGAAGADIGAEELATSELQEGAASGLSNHAADLETSIELTPGTRKASTMETAAPAPGVSAKESLIVVSETPEPSNPSQGAAAITQAEQPNAESLASRPRVEATRDLVGKTADLIPTRPAEIILPVGRVAEPTTATRAAERASAAMKPQASPAVIAALLARAEERRKRGDILGARLFLEHAANAGHAEALFLLAQTYDARALAEWRTRGVQPDQSKAARLYEEAAALRAQRTARSKDVENSRHGRR